MAKTGENIRAIERELAEHFASMCLDNKPERMKVARWIAKREEGLAVAEPPRSTPAPALATDTDPPPAVEATPPLPQEGLYRIRVYDVRLVQSRRPFMLNTRFASDSKTAATAFQSLIAMTDREHLACLFLNGNHEITGAHIVAIGAQNRIGGVDPRVIFRAAFLACAAAIVLGHNHPSGDPSPSADDIRTTENIMRGAAVLGIPVVDHIIVTREPGRYHSMCDRGILPKV
jgi:DNA repair protein RadC